MSPKNTTIQKYTPVSEQDLFQDFKRLNQQPNTTYDKKVKADIVTIEEVEIQLDKQFGSSGWSWEIESVTPWGVMKNDSSGNPLVGVCMIGHLYVTFDDGTQKKVGACVTDFVSYGTINNNHGNKGSVLSSIALKQAAAKLGTTFGRGQWRKHRSPVYDEMEAQYTIQDIQDMLIDFEGTESELEELYKNQVPSKFKKHADVIKLFKMRKQDIVSSNKDSE